MNSEKNLTPKIPVLIVSGNTSENDVIQKAVAGKGFELFFVETEKKALTLIESQLFPIMVVNPSCSVTDGFQLCSTIKKKLRNNSVFFILMAEKNELRNNGNSCTDVDEYLIKPLNDFELSSRLNNARKIVIHTAAQLKSERKHKDMVHELNQSKHQIKKNEKKLGLFRKSRYIQTGKLEAIGKMAAGIAHEINTPVQYVGDNIHFLKDSFEEISHILASYRSLYNVLKIGGDAAPVMQEVESTLLKYDLNYLEKELPETISQSTEGLDRISGIVLAMRNLSHPGKDANASVDINQAIQSTITLTRNEWKHIAEMKTSFAPNLSHVSCHPGEFNQVILNLIINAAHAVSDTLKNSGDNKGTIEITTSKKETGAEITISDSGPGIPEEIRDKIFEPFFTTKDAGKGTGQGLAISHSVISTYGGDIRIKTGEDKGAAFIITLPFCKQKKSLVQVSKRPPMEKTTTITSNNGEKKRILFVDDDPDVLKGLQRMLNHMKNDWEMTFTGSGVDALACLNKTPFNVIVTDCRMSGMHGLDLLTHVKKSFPHVVRIMLSGETEKKILMKAVNIVHQFIAKPCNASVLKEAIYRTCMLRDLLEDESLRKTLSGIESLPAVPSLYTDITNELTSPDPSIKKAGKIISGDVAMTSKVLQLVNSAYFGLPTHISSPETAVIMLGLDTIQSLILHFELFSKFKIKKKFLPFLEPLKEHNMSTGAFSKIIADHLQMDRVSKDQAFMAGLLHDCGKLILIAHFPDLYEKVLDLSQKNNISVELCEKEVFGVTHAEAGAYLMGIWGLPHPIVEAINFHHHPLNSPGNKVGPLTAVHLANSFHHEMKEAGDVSIKSAFDDDYLNTVDLGMQVHALRNLCIKDASKSLDNEQ